MTFDEAVEVVTEYGVGYGIKRGLLLDSLTLIRDDLAYCENDEGAPMMVTQREIAAYRIVCREMRKLFV